VRTREVIKRIAAEAKRQKKSWSLDRKGANHDVYSLDGVLIPIPRHTEMGNLTAEMIWKECEEKLGKGWWR
jgi:hypothetical protein